ncbi:MAG: class I SAM-dependent methyltransferase [Nocardioidaceae bacterium]
MSDQPTESTFNASEDPFDDIYAAVGDDLSRVPWAGLAPNPLLVDWFEHPPPGAEAPAIPEAEMPPRALVIACGLGDDAEELSSRGYDVCAFDFSPTAIGWCHRRWTDSTVDYRVADLFELPASWQAGFDLVVEVNTIQSLPPEQHRSGIAAVARAVAPNAVLFARCSAREDDEPAPHRPWRLTRTELAAFAEEGLDERDFYDGVTANGRRQFRLIYRRPAAPA